MHSKMNVQCFKGKSLKPYLHSIARIRCDVYREYPYLYEVDIEHEQEYLEKHLTSDEAVGVLVFDGSTIVGVSTGAPLEKEPETIQHPFLDKGLDISSFYYFGKSFLLKPYRGRGVGHHFFDHREAHTHNLGRFKYTCFSTIARPENHPLKPKEYLPFDDFWKKRGYHPNMTFKLQWKDAYENKPSDKPMVIWTKDLHN